ncbi:MAG: hypothetical protein A3J48_02770 [Candidatus Doudnabacteria bacterium RIFCSPHIGHO2_02_FULL_46_11]|uniref:Uncharacterized protein n=1 Tax=Candidatus Doudnabacteria bacterium RIFCSPHIGHO2_02_FULL_46_11 TaxID=1817832 RepID=A0A1F5P587_9BACT|nr:MAG: hypothetical protein A3J48_02770 [Candidatus Doudnabacteria bacterium RIFCSPHIGHO2_02_FULL_46_11]
MSNERAAESLNLGRMAFQALVVVVVFVGLVTLLRASKGGEEGLWALINAGWSLIAVVALLIGGAAFRAVQKRSRRKPQEPGEYTARGPSEGLYWRIIDGSILIVHGLSEDPNRDDPQAGMQVLYQISNLWEPGMELIRAGISPSDALALWYAGLLCRADLDRAIEEGREIVIPGWKYQGDCPIDLHIQSLAVHARYLSA